MPFEPLKQKEDDRDLALDIIDVYESLKEIQLTIQEITSKINIKLGCFESFTQVISHCSPYPEREQLMEKYTKGIAFIEKCKESISNINISVSKDIHDVDLTFLKGTY